MAKSQSIPPHDSTPWKLAARAGDIVIPDHSEFKRLPIAEKSANKRRFGQHYDTIGLDVVEFITGICDKIGVTPRELQMKIRARMLFNAHVYREIASKYKKEEVVEAMLFEAME